MDPPTRPPNNPAIIAIVIIRSLSIIYCYRVQL